MVKDLKQDDPLRPVTVLVPNDYAGRMVHWLLGRRGGYVNVITCRLTQLIASVAQSISSKRLPPLLAVLEESAARQALRRSASAFGTTSHRSLQQALIELFRELRRGEVDVDVLSQAQPSRAAQAALGAYREFQAMTAVYDNPTRRASRAADDLNHARFNPSGLARFGPLILFLPTRLDPAEARFLAAAARWVPFSAALADLADPQGIGDEAGQAIARCLADALGIAPPAPNPPPDKLHLGAEVRILRAPDPAEEVREVIRCIADDLARGVPLHRTAILYRQDEPYAPLVREMLDLAGLPWSSSEGKRLDQTRPGRCLLGLLGLPERRFARDALMEWLETGPISDLPAEAISPASWDRLSRAANVIWGPDQWEKRLTAYAGALDERAREHEREGKADAAIEGLRRQATSARVIAEFVATLGADLQPPSGPATWTTFVDWARGLRDRYVGPPNAWSEDEAAAALAVDRALDSLREADRIDPQFHPTLPDFLAALASALDSHRLPTGQPGDGILIEPVTAVAGLTFDRVYVLGLREGAFPPSSTVDPFFPDSASDPLHRRAQQLARERQDFLLALATADHGVLTLSTSDTDGTRTAFPSRWLLEIASIRAGRTLSATEFTSLRASEYPWLRVVHSALQGVSREVTPADLEDRRLQQAARWTQAGRPLHLHPLARRRDLPLGRALELIRERRSSLLSPFDGNVSALAGQARRLASIFDGQRAISASAVQSWATCGFQYFLERVLGVEPTERPEDAWTIDALERGSLIHAILEEFFRELYPRGVPRPGHRYGPDDAKLLERIAAKHFTEIEATGITGHPIAWENAQQRILADLGAFLVEDEKWRLEQGLVPSYYEHAFGFEDPGSWPALDVSLPIGSVDSTIPDVQSLENAAVDGHGDDISTPPSLEPTVTYSRLRFRGVIDRIDLDTATGRAHVFDYKTGSTAPYQGLCDDPVVAGQHVQLALYGRAVRQNLSRLARVGATFWFITAKGQFKQIGPSVDEDAVAARLDEVLSVIARGIRMGAFPQVPGPADNDTFVNCRHCDFERVCPTPSQRDALWKRKQADPLARPHLELTLTTVTSDA